MSEKKNVTSKTTNEKVMTKYDIKEQKRKEAAAKARKEELKGIILGAVLVVVLIGFIASFPIRSYLAENTAYFYVDGDKVTKAEFAYMYNTTKQGFVTQMSDYLEFMGVTDTSKLDEQYYMEGVTYRDYFTELVVQSVAANKGMLKKAKAEGFEYDTSADLAQMKAEMESYAAYYGVDLDGFISAQYGNIASWKRLEDLFAEEIFITAYSEKLMDECAPTEEEVQKEYEENKAYYDSVDYRMTIVDADIPTTTTDKDGNEVAYTATEDEVKKAMQEAKKAAEEAKKTVAEDGTEYVNNLMTGMTAVLAEYLYDESRKAGDTVVLEDADNNRYLAVAFEKRYLDETPTHTMRMISTNEVSVSSILKEWENGAQTEESFIELVAKYDQSGNPQGLFENADPRIFEGTALGEWLKEERKAGDIFGAQLDDGYDYVVYYLEESIPSWKVSAEGLLASAEFSLIMSNVSEGIEVEDPDNVLPDVNLSGQTAE